MMQVTNRLASAAFDGIAIKPSSTPASAVDPTAVDVVAIDFEGLKYLPSPETVERLGRSAEVVLTAPVRADGFDPFGDDSRFDAYADHARFALVAGNRAYLERDEARRAVSPRLATALDRVPDAWVGTEGIERVALATGATQYELLSRTTSAEVAALRTAGFEGELVVYAPTVLTADRSRAVDRLEGYLSRRSAVARAIESGEARETVLDRALDEYALVGEAPAIADRIASLKRAGVTAVIGHPADAA